ncbi:NAD(P)/FAD-dependent oxidoreductase [Sphingobium sp. TCM1]|uniref:NAD(P)/FAD-dependent oxidoreductase n=1 Tax=Sphingobium sp. TCM1 TaxID=453246 RepID=UPI0007F3BF84|nr:FAD-dependent oxidoreductase [Sphingobium sp. TCM1]OAN56263.1 pyridine nucleotide-disulfide oxidoreductase [Sphingobium sp. TCM1]
MSGEAFRTHIIIGSGLAGYGVVRELRRNDPNATIMVMTRDAGHFYSKPALSTALAKQKSPDALVTMPAERMVATQKICLRANMRVTAIDTAAHTISVGGENLNYDTLTLATGAQPVRMRLDGNAAEAPFCINALDDYVAFRAALAADMHVAIIGAGLVGTEFANDLSHVGHRVTVMDPLAGPLGQLVPTQVGRAVRDALTGQGVDWRLGMSVTAIDHAVTGYRLTLSDGATVEADIVISAIGLRPDTALAQAAGITVGRGIIVDDHGRTSAPDVYAIGDCAQYPHGLSAYVTPIMTAARAIAATATGTPSSMQFPPLSVQVKTSACPLVLLPPPAGLSGDWRCIEEHEDALKYLFVDGDGAVRGYAMTGRFCDERMDMDKAIHASVIGTSESLRHVA